jgi:WD40 repeat protein/serine/threonine protein kinase
VVIRSVGDYEFIEEIGRGGMGVVWKARQRSLNRIVALKFILAGSFASREFIERFRAEATAAARLKHPNIVAVHEVGEHEGHHYFSMDFIEGRSLAQLVRAEPPSPRQAAHHLRLIAEAIHHAHQRGIVHRDLKPSNILVDAAGEPHITDFGLARELNSEDYLTLTGHAFGSPSFAAPEQIGGARLSAAAAPPLAQAASEIESQPTSQVAARREPRVPLTRSVDIYGLGAILYYLLTGRPPFVGTTLANILCAVQEKEPVAPRLLNADVSADLETICLKCLEKEPQRRYQTAQEIADDLDRFLRNEPIHARPITRAERTWRWCRRKPALASFVAATALLLLAILIGSPIALYRIHQARKAEQMQLKRTEEESLKARQFAYASDMNLAHQAVQEDDFYRARQLLDRHRPNGEGVRGEGRGASKETASLTPAPQLLPRPSSLVTDLRGWEWHYLWRQCQGEERFILGEHTNGATAVGLLADGKTVFSAGWDKSVRLWDLESRRQIGLLPHAEAVIGATASPDGRWLATASRKYGEGQPVLLWNLATHEISTTLTSNFWLRPGSITFSPDTKWLAFGTVFGGVRLWDVKARTEVTNLPSMGDGWTGPLGVAFSPDSRTLAFNENEYGEILLWDIARRSVMTRLTGHQSFVIALAFSPDGQTLASGSQDRTARLWNVAERREGFVLTNHSGGFGSLAFSRDGRTLAMSGAGGAGRVIRLVEVETGKQKAELPGHLEDISGLAFTSDGQTLLSASSDGTVRIWDPVPRAKAKSVQEFVPNSISVAWRSYGPALCLSPDGRHLLTVYTNQSFSVWDTLRLAEGEPHPLPFTNTSFAAVAPGGRLAAFGSRSGELMLWDAETGQARFFPRPETNNIHRLVFSLDGRSLAADYDTKTRSQMSVGYQRRTVRVWDVGTRKETHTFDTDGEFPVSLTFSADAKALLAGFSKGPIKLWPLDGPGQAATFPGHSGWVGGLAMLPDGQTLISAAQEIQFWDVRTRHENALKLSPRAGEYHCLSLSPDGRRFAAGASDGRIMIWDMASHQEVATLSGHKESVIQLAFTPDGDHLVSASQDQLRVWRAASPVEADAASKKEPRK